MAILTITPSTVEYRRDAMPKYPKFATGVTKWHKLPRTPENIAAHAKALFGALTTLQRAKFKRGTTEPEHRAPCASGTWHSDGKAILKAVNAQNKAHAAGELERDHKKRTDKQIAKAYAAAMNGGPDANQLVNTF